MNAKHKVDAQRRNRIVTLQQELMVLQQKEKERMLNDEEDIFSDPCLENVLSQSLDESVEPDKKFSKNED